MPRRSTNGAPATISSATAASSFSAELSPSPVAAAPKITSGTASGIINRPASAPARGRPAVSAATATASAARAGVPMASEIRLRASAGPSRPTRKLPGTAAISSSGPKVSQ